MIDQPCVACGHAHDYTDEPCVSCGCDATYLNEVLAKGLDKNEEWVRRLVRSWLRDPAFMAIMESLGDD